MSEKPSIEFQIYDWVEDHFIEPDEDGGKLVPSLSESETLMGDIGGNVSGIAGNR